MGRIVETRTGITSMGYEEIMTVELCDRCDENEGEYIRGKKIFCEPCLGEWEMEQAEKKAEDAAEEQELLD